MIKRNKLRKKQFKLRKKIQLSFLNQKVSNDDSKFKKLWENKTIVVLEHFRASKCFKFFSNIFFISSIKQYFSSNKLSVKEISIYEKRICIYWIDIFDNINNFKKIYTNFGLLQYLYNTTKEILLCLKNDFENVEFISGYIKYEKYSYFKTYVPLLKREVNQVYSRNNFIDKLCKININSVNTIKTSIRSIIIGFTSIAKRLALYDTINFLLELEKILKKSL